MKSDTFNLISYNIDTFNSILDRFWDSDDKNSKNEFFIRRTQNSFNKYLTQAIVYQKIVLCEEDTDLIDSTTKVIERFDDAIKYLNKSLK